MNNMFKILVGNLTIFFFLCASLISPTLAYAGEEIATVTEGQPTPFDGTLFNTEAAARLLIDLEFSQEACQIETTRQLQLQEAQFHLEIDVLQASRDSLQFRFDETLAIRDDHILYLEKKITKKKVPPEVIFAIGVLSGVALTIGAGYAIGQAANP